MKTVKIRIPKDTYEIALDIAKMSGTNLQDMLTEMVEGSLFQTAQAMMGKHEEREAREKEDTELFNFQES